MSIIAVIRGLDKKKKKQNTSIMPESSCTDCHDTHWSPTREGLEKWELEHHKKSFKKAEEGSLALSIGVEGFQ